MTTTPAIREAVETRCARHNKDYGWKASESNLSLLWAWPLTSSIVAWMPFPRGPLVPICTEIAYIYGVFLNVFTYLLTFILFRSQPDCGWLSLTSRQKPTGEWKTTLLTTLNLGHYIHTSNRTFFPVAGCVYCVIIFQMWPDRRGLVNHRTPVENEKRD